MLKIRKTVLRYVTCSPDRVNPVWTRNLTEGVSRPPAQMVLVTKATMDPSIVLQSVLARIRAPTKGTTSVPAEKKDWRLLRVTERQHLSRARGTGFLARTVASMSIRIPFSRRC